MRKQQQTPASEPEKFERWTAQRKVAIILEVLKGQVSVPKRRGGMASLKVSTASGPMSSCEAVSTRSRSIAKGLDAEHRSEIRRLQAKIGQLVMDNEIAKEALRIIPLDESEQRSIDSLLGKASRESASAES